MNPANVQADPDRYADFEGSDTVEVEVPRIALPPRPRPQAAAIRPAGAPVPVPVAEVADAGVAPHVGVKASVCQIPARLLDPIADACRVQGLSHAQLIIAAIEGTYDRLGELIRPPAAAGGSLFAARRGRVSRVDDGPLTQFSFRMSGEDFAVLDRLVAQFGATSRAQLITAALAEYLGAAPTRRDMTGHPPDHT
jgi:hypothetical protein